MKKLNIALAAGLVLVSLQAAKAEGIDMDFDGSYRKAVSFSEALKSDAVTAAAVPAPEVASGGSASQPVKLDLRVIEGDSVRKETLLCSRGDNGAAVKDCRKQSDKLPFSAAEAKSYRIEPFFQPGGVTFRSLLNNAETVNKVHCFNVVKECVAWKVVREKVCEDWVEYHGSERCASWVMEEYEVCSHYDEYCND
jgi:hypothetical protein